MGKEAPEGQLSLPPGFRFYPTDEELVVQYLSRQASSQPFAASIIAEVDLYKFDPWALPEKALFGEKEWYFFSPRDRKYPNGSRPNRAAGSGYWKATGTDKPIISGGSHKVGVKKALVFYIGKAPRGTKTNWIMHEYRLADGSARAARKKGSLRLDDWVLCRIYKKSSGSAQKGARKSQMEDALASLPGIDDHRLASLQQISTLRPLMDEKSSSIMEKIFHTPDNIINSAWKNAVAPSDGGFYHLEQYYNNAPAEEAENGLAAGSSRCYAAMDGRSNAYTNLGGLPPLLHIEYHGERPRRSIHEPPDEVVESTFGLHQNNSMFAQSELINFNNGRGNRESPPVISQQQLDPVATSVFDSAFLATLGVDYPHRPQ